MIPDFLDQKSSRSDLKRRMTLGSVNGFAVLRFAAAHSGDRPSLTCLGKLCRLRGNVAFPSHQGNKIRRSKNRTLRKSPIKCANEILILYKFQKIVVVFEAT